MITHKKNKKTDDKAVCGVTLTGNCRWWSIISKDITCEDCLE